MTTAAAPAWVSPGGAAVGAATRCLCGQALPTTEAGVVGRCWLCGRGEWTGEAPVVAGVDPAGAEAPAAMEAAAGAASAAALVSVDGRAQGGEAWTRRMAGAAVGVIAGVAALMVLGVLIWALRAPVPSVPRVQPEPDVGVGREPGQAGQQTPGQAGGDDEAGGAARAGEGVGQLPATGVAEGTAGRGGDPNPGERTGAAETGADEPAADASPFRVGPEDALEIARLDELRQGFASDLLRSHAAERAARVLGQVESVARGTDAVFRGSYAARSGGGRRGGFGRGMTQESENAVELGLQYLRSAQREDGSWRGSHEADAATQHTQGFTALATLAFLGAGHTHLHPGPHRDVVERALGYLTKQLDSSGRVWRDTFYEQGLVAAALCEALGMTGDSNLIDPSQRTIRCIVKQQGPSGGWAYSGPGSDGHVTSFQVIAIRSASLAGLSVQQDVVDRAMALYSQLLTANGRTLYSIEEPNRSTLGRDAMGLYVRTLMGQGLDREEVARIAQRVDGMGPTFDNEFQVYYGTYGMFQLQGSYWGRWNARFRDALIHRQERSGRMRGAWKPVIARGPVGSTAMNVMSLEVYYRFLPINRLQVAPGVGRDAEPGGGPADAVKPVGVQPEGLAPEGAKPEGVNPEQGRRLPDPFAS